MRDLSTWIMTLAFKWATLLLLLLLFIPTPNRSVLEREMPLPCIPVGPDPDVEPGLPLPANEEDLMVDARKYLPAYVKEVKH